MFDYIKFSVYEKAIYINDKPKGYLLGELTTNFLNITDDYRDMRELMEKVHEKAETYKQTKELSVWWDLNNNLEEVDRLLMRYQLFQVIRRDSFNVFDETRTYTGQIRLLEDPDETIDFSEFVPDLVLQDDGTYRIEKAPFDIIEASENAPNSDLFLITLGGRKQKWNYYENLIRQYDGYLHDIRAFNITIHYFIDYGLTRLEHLNPSSYAASLNAFLNNPRSYKWIVNPVEHGGMFELKDDVKMWHSPYELDEGSGEFAIFECYEVQTVQTFLKSDFFKALSVGHLIRKCKHCGKYFLQQKAYHTMYCDRPSPENPKYTCHQIGSRTKKELSENIPKTRSMHRALDRIYHDFLRGVITEEEKALLNRRVSDLHNKAITSPRISSDEFEAMLQSDTLYKVFGVIRKTRPRGRPKANLKDGN